MIEIRVHGRGGQGSVTMAELVAIAVFYDGKYSQAFPNFGVERRGAPVTAYVRVDDKFICLRSQIYKPDFIIVQDASLVHGVNVFDGSKNDTVFLINSEKDKSSFKIPSGIDVVVIPATKIAIEIIGRPIINTVLLGSFAALTGQIKLKSVEKAIKERFDGEIAEKNVEAARRGFQFIASKQ